MFTTGFGQRVDSILAEKLSDVHANPRYQDRGTFVETSQMGDGFYIERGGIWNDLEGRVATGLTKSDVNDVRVALGKLGMVFSFDQVDNILQEALRMTKPHELADTQRFHDFAKEHGRALRARYVDKLKREGKCVTCASSSKSRSKSKLSNIPAPGKTTCPRCNAASAKRHKRMRAAEKRKKRSPKTVDTSR